jgi:hypothetical protein
VKPTPFASIFEHTFDTVVFGAGFVGLSAARALAAQGIDTLLVESSGDLLWEATRALENTTTASAPSPAWETWLSSLAARQAADTHWFDPAFAEILSAHELTSSAKGPRTLFYASPVAIETGPSGLTAVVVATKSGPRRLQARRWIDATEQAHVTRLAQPSLVTRTPSHIYRNAVLQTTQPDILDAALVLLLRNHTDLECLPSLRTGERRLRWTTGAAAAPWHLRLPALIRELRVLTSAPFVVSHCAMQDFPVYAAATAATTDGLPANLLVFSPSLRGEILATPADRHALGTRLTSALSPIPASAHTLSTTVAPAPQITLDACDVLVAGAGTGGALAAIAAAREGARTVVLDATSYPGGIGTGAGICGYFHGAKGGLQSDIDLRVQAMSELLAGTPHTLSGWHHEAKKIILLQSFDESGVTFLGDTLLTGVERDTAGRVLAALVVTGGRLVRLPAAAFVDSTGDGDLAALAGASFVTGREGDGRTLSYSQSIFSLVTHENRTGVRSCNFDAGWVDPTDPEDLSRARLAGIAQHLLIDWTPPDRAVAVSPLLGLRQSRQIDTDHTVVMADLVGHARFDDSIGEVETVADTHSVDFEFESDELAFYYWSCRGFRHDLRSELPYRMLLPRGLANVWVACRATGISVDAAYGLRMQREMQRLGEVSGIAAARAAANRTDSRRIDFAALQTSLDHSGARRADRPESPVPPATELFAALETGLPGVHLWHLSRCPDLHADAVRARLASAHPRVSFYAATLLAMWNNPAAEPRLLTAVAERETGPTPEEKPVRGAFAQCIDAPFWLQAVVFLRRVGTARSLPALLALAQTPANPLNVRTTLALTLERLAQRLGAHTDLIAALDALLSSDIPDPLLPPSRSLWRTLNNEAQKKLGNDRGAPVAEDHTWQLHLIVARTRQALALAPLPAASIYAQDTRAFVRQAFARLA